MTKILLMPVSVIIISAAAAAFFNCADDAGRRTVRESIKNAAAGAGVDTKEEARDNAAGTAGDKSGGDAADGGSAEQPVQPGSLDESLQYTRFGAVFDTKDKGKPGGKKSDDAVIEIREKMFIAQTDEIYINAKDYFGRTIRYEGIFREVAGESGGKYRFVIRYGPGCCPGDVSAAGFEVAWDKGYPKQDDWVEASGVLEQYEEGGIPALRLALKSLTVLTKRGKERVTR